MRERVGELVGRSVRAMWVTTFHSACARMLRADAERLGYARSFTIYDESDSLRMLKRCMTELGVDPKRYPPRAIRSQISGAKNKLVDAAAYAEAAGQRLRGNGRGTSTALYEKRMLAANAMDFDDLLVRTVNVLELSEEARERWRRTFRHVLVDEYQDTNHAQYRLLQLLTAEHGNLMVVGDEDQSIYGFRHADIRNILDFERDFPEAEVVKLEQNYRSTQTILSAANAVVERNRERRPKQLWTEIAGGEPVQLSELADEHEEARWVAGEIERLAEEEGVKREDVAVFYRTNAMSRVLEDTLNRFDLPYQVIGGTKFYERAEIKDAVAYLSLLANPADQVSFARIVNSPRRGIGNTSQGRLASHANTTGLPIWEVVESGRGGAGPGRARAIKAVSRFHETMEGLRERAEEAPGRRAARGGAERERLPGSAGGRAHDRGRGPGREPRGAGRRRRRVRHRARAGGRERDPAAGGVPAADLPLHPAGRPARGRVAGHADDPAQRQGARVRHGLHRRLRGRRLPAHAGAGRGGRRGGAAPLLRRHHPRPPAPLHDLGARAAPLRPRRAQPALALRRRAAGGADRAPLERAGRGGGIGWELGRATRRRRSIPARPWSCRPATTSSTPASATGWSPAVEPGGVVVVRFAGDGTERKLMADYAPIRRR